MGKDLRGDVAIVFDVPQNSENFVKGCMSPTRRQPVAVRRVDIADLIPRGLESLTEGRVFDVHVGRGDCCSR